MSKRSMSTLRRNGRARTEQGRRAGETDPTRPSPPGHMTEPSQEVSLSVIFSLTRVRVARIWLFIGAGRGSGFGGFCISWALLDGDPATSWVAVLLSVGCGCRVFGLAGLVGSGVDTGDWGS